jgi:hypothetical protein
MEKSKILCGDALLELKEIESDRRFSLIWLRKPFIGELTERKIMLPQNENERKES